MHCISVNLPVFSISIIFIPYLYPFNSLILNIDVLEYDEFGFLSILYPYNCMPILLHNSITLLYRISLIVEYSNKFLELIYPSVSINPFNKPILDFNEEYKYIFGINFVQLLVLARPMSFKWSLRLFPFISVP